MRLLRDCGPESTAQTLCERCTSTGTGECLKYTTSPEASVKVVLQVETMLVVRASSSSWQLEICQHSLKLEYSTNFRVVAGMLSDMRRCGPLVAGVDILHQRRAILTEDPDWKYRGLDSYINVSDRRDRNHSVLIALPSQSPPRRLQNHQSYRLSRGSNFAHHHRSVRLCSSLRLHNPLCHRSNQRKYQASRHLVRQR